MIRKGLVICGPDVAYGPLALLSGTFAEKVRKAAALGFDGVELMVRDPAGLDWQAVRTTLADAGLTVPQVVTGELFGADRLCMVTGDEAIYKRAEERLHAVIDLAAFLGAMVNLGRVRGRLDMLPPEMAGWETAVQRIGRLCEYAAERGVRITLEPLNRYEADFILNVNEGMRFLGDVGAGNLGLMLDLFHMNIEETDMADALRLAGDRLWHVHIADSNRQFPGSGHLDFTAPFSALSSMGYGGFVSAELLPLPDADTAAQRTMDFLNLNLPKA
jgi:sugar phosphate isomerase/epimerase